MIYNRGVKNRRRMTEDRKQNIECRTQNHRKRKSYSLGEWIRDEKSGSNKSFSDQGSGQAQVSFEIVRGCTSCGGSCTAESGTGVVDFAAEMQGDKQRRWAETADAGRDMLLCYGKSGHG